MEVEDEESQGIVRWVKETQIHHPTLLFIDSIRNLSSFLKRTYSYEIGEQAIAKSQLSSHFSVPNYYLLPKGQNLRESLQQHSNDLLSFQIGMELPILVKPEWTVGTPESHVIDILITEDSLPDCYDKDMVVQSYKDHNGVIYKAYAIADAVFLEKRFSLPNVANCIVCFFHPHE